MKRRGLLGLSGALALAACVRPARAASNDLAVRPRRLVVVHAVGGWDPTWVLDPKPGVAGIDGGTGDVAVIGGVPILSHASRPAVDRFFSAWGRQTVVVNGVFVGAFTHRTGERRMLTGSARAGALAERRYPAVHLETGAHWDTHVDNDRQGALFDGLFASLDALLSALERARQLESTVVFVLSELGRAPRRNAAGGKDHWPVTSCLIAGAGVRGGRVLGATDDALRALPVDMQSGIPLADGRTIEPRHLVTGVLAHVGVAPGRLFPGVEPLRGFGALPPRTEPENARSQACSGIDRA